MSDEPAKLLGQPVVGPRRQVEELIRSAIFSGELQVGERLPAEAELARQFEVSRTTIREALQSLWAQGLIRKIPGSGGGSFVESVDHHSLEQVVEQSLHRLLSLGSLLAGEVNVVRELLELPAVRMAAHNRTEGDLSRLRAVIDKASRVAAGDPSAAALDTQFHTIIAEASGNRVLAAFVTAIHADSSPDAQAEQSDDVHEAIVRQHRQILDAIEASDADEAEALAISHLTFIRGRVAPQSAFPAGRLPAAAVLGDREGQRNERDH